MKVNNIICQALLNTSERSSYASTALLDRFKLKPLKKKTKKYRYDDVLKLEKNTFLSLTNPNYKTIKDRCKHLAGIKIDDNDTKTKNNYTQDFRS